nr:hypothetical protein BaRGS_033033 [Batillaria attramentaria]
MAQALQDTEKTAERTRIHNLFQSVDKALTRSTKKTATEDLQQIRYATSKLLHILSGQDKLHRDMVLKQAGHVDILVTVLQEMAATDELLLQIHAVLAKTGHKDRKFAVKARLHRTLLLTLNLIKNHTTAYRFLQQLLQVLRLYTSNNWHNADSKNRNIILRKAILNTLKNITNLKSGRRAFMEADGIRVLYNSAQEVMDVREVESLVEDDQGDGLEPPEIRSIDELRMYDKFFPEVFEFDMQGGPKVKGPQHPFGLPAMCKLGRDFGDDVDQGTNSSSEDLEDENVEVVHDPHVYRQMAGDTRSVYRFQKLAYPDLYGARGAMEPEPLYNRKFGVQRSKVFEDLDRMIHPDTVLDTTVYDVDMTVNMAGDAYRSENSNLSNRDELSYRFNIVNCEKINSQFNSGMQPVMFSVAEAMQGRGAWVRTGVDICYYRNHFLRSSSTTGGVKGKGYYTATFTVSFSHSHDICYLAYHYPYTYTMLRTHLYQWETLVDHNQVFFRNQTLCTVDFLMSNKPTARQLREMYIFKIVPMINPDGVINGNHRSSLVAEDLNRRWMRPCPRLHPTIYHTKGLLQYLSTVNKTPLVYCDYHGHSRRKNIFMYGCMAQLSWMTNDTQNPASTGIRAEDKGAETLPRILHLSCPSFSFKDCSFVVERAKETTARVVVWRQIGVDQHINTRMLEEMGQKFCEALVRLAKNCSAFDQQLPVFGAASSEFGVSEGLEDSRLKPSGAGMDDDNDLGSDSDDEVSGDDEENYPEDEDLTM